MRWAWLAQPWLQPLRCRGWRRPILDVTAAAGIDYVQFRRSDYPGRDAELQDRGVAAGDYDGDGLVDLYVTRLDDSDILYRNRVTAPSRMSPTTPSDPLTWTAISTCTPPNGGSCGR